MGTTTEITWCDSTVNPLVGCNGCELHRAGAQESHCYAASLVRRHCGKPGWPASFDHPEHFPGRLHKAIGWPDLTGTGRLEKPWLTGYPRLVFTCDLADPFTDSIDPETWLTPALPLMAASQHTYILLSKRGRRMLDYFQHHPIPANVWPGVTVTGPASVKRLDSLVQIAGASVRFVSLEPLLGPVDISPYLARGINWVIVGGESGPGARAMNPDWVRTVRDECGAAGVPFFMKQWGGVNKAKTGRMLDGQEWLQMPPPQL